MATEVGVGYVSIVPEMAGFSKKLQGQLGSSLSTVGKQAGRQIGDDVTDGVDGSIAGNRRRLGDAGRSAGRSIVGGVGDAINGSTATLGNAGKIMAGALMAGAVASAAALGAKMVSAVRGAIESASRQEQSLGAMDAIFKADPKSMQKNARAAVALGLSTSDYAEAAAQLGAQLQNLGFEQSKLGPQSDELVKIAADMAAQFGGTTLEAVQALAAAFRGETDPIERYGVSIKEASIEAEAASLGLHTMAVDQTKVQSASARLAKAQESLNKKMASGTATATDLASARAAVASAEQAYQKAVSGKADDLSPLAKAQAALSLLNKQLKNTGTIGAWNRELDTTAAKVQKSKAAWENAKAEFGKPFAPSMGKLAEFGAKILPQLVQTTGPALKRIGESVEVIIGKMAERTPEITKFVGDFANKLADAAVWIKDHWDQISAAIGKGWAALSAAMRGSAKWIRDNWPEIVDTARTLGDTLQTAGKWAKTLWDAFLSLPPEVRTMIAMLAIAQKTGVLSVAFKGVDFVKQLFTKTPAMSVQAAHVSVNGATAGGTGAAGKGGAAAKAGAGGVAATAAGILSGVAIGAAASVGTRWVEENVPQLKNWLRGLPGLGAGSDAAWSAADAAGVATDKKSQGKSILSRAGGVMWGGLNAALLGLPQAIMETLNASGGIGEAMKRLGSGLITKFREGVASQWSMISGALTAIPRMAISNFSSAVSQMWVKGSGLISEWWRGIREKWNEMYAWVTGLPGKIVGVLAGMNQRMTAIGKDVIQGMIVGITSRAQAVTDTLGDVVGSAVDWVKDLLGISSPSKVYTEIGENTAQGLADGIEANTPAVASAMASMMATVVATGKRPPGGGMWEDEVMLPDGRIIPKDNLSTLARSASPQTWPRITATGKRPPGGGMWEDEVLLPDGRIVPLDDLPRRGYLAQGSYRGPAFNFGLREDEVRLPNGQVVSRDNLRIRRAFGGTIPGVGNRDSVPAMLTPGEFVLNRTMVAQAGGTSALESWRQGLSGPGVNIGEVVINNPAPEPAGMSLNRSIRKVAYVGGAR